MAVVAAILVATADRAPKVAGNVAVNPPGPIDASNSPTVARTPAAPTTW